jgi:hypothetical protein
MRKAKVKGRGRETGEKAFGIHWQILGPETLLLNSSWSEEQRFRGKMTQQSIALLLELLRY